MDGEEAGALALAHIRAAWQPDWEPVVVYVEDAGGSWRVHWHNRVYIETADMDYAMGGLPLLVHKATGQVTDDKGWPHGRQWRQPLALVEPGPYPAPHGEQRARR